MTSLSTKKFHLNLKHYRKKAGLTQDKLARLANMPYNTYLKIESGANTNPTLDSLIKISKALNTSIDTLVFNKPKSKKK